ncbi:phosphatidic acid phosphatase [Arthrobacter sp. MYb227]|uniref:phosphatase PAP2 family protein n=1 Tax=Arthrobacter sp. MYb227 TaxID=1848601 RepID=UPI000CFCBAF5|nr:phosphatase PAP2 family protein [Arthrobacter sp. MYb227]PQZ86706.1 phosphatidic acid phosphatase [Arthrobacter sp. MYb227]
MNASRRRGNLTPGSTITFVLAAVLGVFALARRMWISVRMDSGLASWDAPTLDWMVAHRSPAATNIAWLFSTLGDTLWMSIIALIAIALLSWKTRSYWPGLLIALTAAGSVTLTVVLKNATHRARPAIKQAVAPEPTSYAFPSGHTLNSAAIFGVIGYLLFILLRHQASRIISICVLGAFVLGVGWSRVYLGHHWLTDVLAGLLIGCAWAAIMMILHHFVVLKNRRFARWVRI